MATLGFPLRFESEMQKQSAEKLAKNNNRSLNAHVLYLIDRAILSDKQKSERQLLLSKTKK